MTKTMTLNKLVEEFDSTMFNSYNRIVRAKGFTIGKGKKLYWYVTPYASTGKYRCLPIEKDKSLGYPRWCYPEQIVVIHFL